MLPVAGRARSRDDFAMRYQSSLLALSLFLVTAIRQDAAADQPATPAKPAAAAPKCRAMDNGKAIAEASGEKPADCSFALREDVKKHYCTAGSKGKTFKFTVEYDHKLGAKKWPTSKDQMFCASEVK